MLLARISAILSLCFSASWVYADLVGELSKRLQAIGQLSGTFTQTRRIVGVPLDLVSHGKFGYDVDEGITWQTLEPMNSLVAIRADGVYESSEGNIKNKAIPGSAMTARILMDVFTGNLERLEGDFKIDVQGISGLDWVLHLKPRSETLANYLSEIQVTGGKHAKEVNLFETKGGTTRITLNITEAISANTP